MPSTSLVEDLCTIVGNIPNTNNAFSNSYFMDYYYTVLGSRDSINMDRDHWVSLNLLVSVEKL